MNADTRITDQSGKGKGTDSEAAGEASSFTYAQDQEPSYLCKEVFLKEKAWTELDKHLRNLRITNRSYALE